MQVWDDPARVPAGTGPSVVALGTFDGVHRGHAAVLGAVVERARERGALAAAVTFDRHPLELLAPDRAPGALTSTARRLELMAATGLDAALVLPFTAEVASWTAQRFVDDVLVGALGARCVVAGRDVRFGAEGAGTLALLRAVGPAAGFEVAELDDAGGAAGERRWSSTWVRELLAAGDAAAAARQLGRPHRLTGVVVHGDHRGRELGYPTANLDGIAEVVPADGVYAGWLVRGAAGAQEDAVLPAAVSIGTNPTFDGLERRVEAHALVPAGTPLDLYGERIALDLVDRLRPTLRFTSAAELVVQMDADVVRAREVLAALGGGPAVQPPDQQQGRGPDQRPVGGVGAGR